METIKSNYKLYLMEALGLGIFMISACFFAGELWHKGAFLYDLIADNNAKYVVMGVAMGFTALLIFYSPFTSPSGSHINPAVTLVNLRLGNITGWNAFLYIVFQFLGGTVAVYIMKAVMGNILTDDPVNYVITAPGQGVSDLKAALYESGIGYIMITMVLYTSSNARLKKYTRIFAAILVCVYVIVAGPVSGFGMNPARSFASAFPAGNYRSFWIYLLCPIAGMLAAAETYLLVNRRKVRNQS